MDDTSGAPGPGPEVFRARLDAYFPTNYGTLLSVVQGLALAVIVARVFQLLEEKLDVELVIAYVQLAVVFMAVIAVYFSYVWFQVYARWEPRLSDTAIPFALGALESVTAITAGRGLVWVWVFAAFQLSGIVALAHTSLRLRRPDTGAQAYTAIRALLGKLRIVIGVNVLVSVFALALSIKLWPVDVVIWVVMISSITTSGLYLLLSDRSVARLFRGSLTPAVPRHPQQLM